MKFCLVNLFIVIVGSFVSINAKPIFSSSRIDDIQELTSDNLTTGPSKESHKLGIQRYSIQENLTSSPLRKEKGMRNPVDVFCDYLSVMSYDYLIKKRVDYFTLISRTITNVEKYLGFDSVTTSEEDLSINQTHGNVEARREKLTMDLLLELYPTSGPLVQLLYSSHKQLKNQTYIDKLKPALSNLRIKVDRLKAFNEEEIQIQKNVSSAIITDINSSTTTEEIRKMKVKKNDNGATSDNLTTGPSKESHKVLIQIQKNVSSTINSSHEQLKNQTYIDKLKPTLSNFRIKFDRLKALNEEGIQIQKKVSSTIIETEHASFGSTSTVQQIFPAFADDSQLPLTNAPDTNGITKRIHDNSARNDSVMYGSLIAGVCLIIIALAIVAYFLWVKRKNSPPESYNSVST